MSSGSIDTVPDVLGEVGSLGYEVYRPRSDRPRDPNPSLCRQIYGKMLQYIVYVCIFYVYRIYIYIVV